MFADLVVSITAGLATNLITGLVRGRIWTPAAPTFQMRDFLWSIPATAIPILTWFLIRYRWPLSLPQQAGVLAGSMVVTFAVFSLVPYLAARLESKWQQGQATTTTFSLLVVGLALALLDESLPHYVSLDCPGNSVETDAVFSGRVVDSSREIILEYGPFGDRKVFSEQVPQAGEDGRWFGKIILDGQSGASYQVLAVTSLNERSDICQVFVK